MTTLSQRLKYQDPQVEIESHWKNIEQNIDEHRDRAKRYSLMRVQATRGVFGQTTTSWYALI